MAKGVLKICQIAQGDIIYFMNITKLGHCCLLIKTKNLTILTDPGAYSTGQNTLTGIDLILITHEHPDHLHAESLQAVLKNNPNAQVITNTGVGKVLDGLGITYSVVEGRATSTVQDVLIEAFDGKHGELFEEFGQVQNTGYFIDNKLFYPGDSFTNPEKAVDVLALPVAGPWVKIGDAIRYALEVKPRVAFPVHEGMLVEGRVGGSHMAPKVVFADKGIEWIVLGEGVSYNDDEHK